jgi:hypothetical protein
VLYAIADTLDSWEKFTGVPLRIRVGDRVKIITKLPVFGWGPLSENETGIVQWTKRECPPLELDADREHSRDAEIEVVVKFPSHSEWWALEKELIKI